MKNNFLLSLLLLSMLAPASCKEENTLDVKVRFAHQTGNIPEEIANWPHSLFVFNNHNCTDVKLAENESSLPDINGTEGNRVTAIAFENEKNIHFQCTKPGNVSTGYYVSLLDVNAEIPQIWMEHAPLKNGESLFTMKPLTSYLTVNLQNAPDTLKSISFTVPRMTDVLYLSTGKTEALNTIQNKSVEITRQEFGKTLSLYPMLRANESWNLNYTLNFEHSTQKESINIAKGVEAGQETELNLDFTAYAEESSYTVAFRKSPYGENNWMEQKEQFFKLLPGDDVYKDKNKYYNVYVLQEGRWKSVEVRNTLCTNAIHHDKVWNDWGNAKMLRDTMCYANFIDEFTEPVKIRVQKRTGSFSRVQVRPSSYSIKPVECNKNTIEFTLPDWESRKVSVEFDGDRYHNLFLFPNRPDTNKPEKNAANVKYYGAGEHIAGEITLRENETLYIDEGAVVYGKVFVLGNNVTITGRGILSGEKLPHVGNIYAEGPVLIEVKGNSMGGLKNFTLSGITIIDSPSWTVSIFNTNHVNIDNINMICWILNGDGIDLCSVVDATITDSFLRTYDDCITLKIRSSCNPESDTKDIKVGKCIIWCDYARGIIVGPECGDWSWGTGGINNCLFENCIVLEQPNGEGDFRAALAVVQQEQHGGGAALMENITFRNILIDNIQPTGRPICVEQTQQPMGCTMQNVLFQNIKITDSFGCKYKSAIKTNNNWIINLIFDNVTYNNEKILGVGDNLHVEGNVEISYK